MSELSLAVPVKLDAFVFNQSVCDGTDASSAKIAPIGQPNYTFLRMTNYMVQHDVLDPVDLHNSAPSTINSRFTDVGRNIVRQNRVGVYLHWMMPRPFRGSTVNTKSARPQQHQRERAMGIQRTSNEENDEGDLTTPIFLQVPNRWLIVRTLDPDAPTTLPPGTKIEKTRAWVVESDRTRSIDDLGQEVDLQVDVSPFLTTFVRKHTDPKDISVDEQAEVFIGSCEDAQSWKEKDADPLNPRVEITAASTSNQLFMDYQYHCGNVFSMVDTFDYKDADGKVRHLEAACASYYVIGWQSDKEKDLLNLAAGLSRQERINALSMALKSETVPDRDNVKKWLDSHVSTRSVFHGALYDVEWADKWDLEKKKKPRIPADEFAQKFVQGKNIAVGTTPIDTILAHVSKHHQGSDLEGFISKLDAYLRAEDETVSGQVIAADEVQNLHFARLDGGDRYTLSETDLKNPAKMPTKDELGRLRDLNAQQLWYDSMMRRVQQLRWGLFAVWWKYISDIDNENGGHNDTYKDQASKLMKIYQRLEKKAGCIKKIIDDAGGPRSKQFVTPPQKAVQGSFYQQNDPTLLMAGLINGWPTDFKEKLEVRLEMQIQFDSPSDDETKKRFPVEVIPCESIRRTAIRLVKEFLALDPRAKQPADKLLPLYHDLLYPEEVESPDNYWRDRWSSRQPWFPLFIEWEADYYHIRFDRWGLKDHPSPAQPSANRIAYGLVGDVTREFAGDKRRISGRTLILPQPNFSLDVRLERLFKTIPKDELEKKLKPDEQAKLKCGLNKLGFLSSPLAGLSDHLATRYNGTHVKPLVSVPGQKPVPLREAREAASKIGITDEMLQTINTESTPTPYGALVALPNNGLPGFKPVTHGQMRFTKLNVVDKFGQVAHATDPLVDDVPPTPLALGEYYATTPTKAGNQPNVVIPPKDMASYHDEFIQLPPMINQPARLNAEFMIPPATDAGNWRLADSWDIPEPAPESESGGIPLWGWVVVNFPDNGLQFFLADGTFYREVRITQGSQSTQKWLPLPPPATIAPDSTTQLDWLIRKMTDGGDDAKAYLAEFMDMVTSSVEHLSEAPDAYGQFPNALVGRPLALVYAGWSLELAADSRKNESTAGGQHPDKRLPIGLLEGDGDLRYQFPVKLGDKDRQHDGLVGYFEARDDVKRPKQGHGDDFELTKCFTYYGHNPAPVYDEKSKQLLTDVSAKYPTLPATWVDPDKDDDDGGTLQDAARRYEARRAATFVRFAAIIDPFLPVNAYSSMLPIKSLKLPTWTWEAAFKKMTTFFHAGPVVVLDDVPSFDAAKQLTERYDLAGADVASAIAMPALQVAEWNWLQPYSVAEKDHKQQQQQPPSLPALSFSSSSSLPSSHLISKTEDEAGDEDEDEEDSEDWDSTFGDDGPPQLKFKTSYMPLGVKKIDVQPVFARGPYTAIEGYMQLRGPIENKPPG
ncbi:hypothetical protein AYL99_03687 [Fonsecaea erecta]|uniref:Uncharacterized protein n=1 Tax=Fonsecaea erecta TaxID=1367422 RepID=A0A178ZNT4_9EURO|nr:hypothetical protein AYL99_03687 [Fonsecaea erecta]OAP61484.1 hypothetical protein AYL99_03687 [Fonsecaea erecta]